jgi:hypothetical protein
VTALRWLLRGVGSLCWVAAMVATAWMLASREFNLRHALGAAFLVGTSMLALAASEATRSRNPASPVLHALLSTAMRLAHTSLGVAAMVSWVLHPTHLLPVATLLAASALLRLLHGALEVAAHACVRFPAPWWAYAAAVVDLLRTRALAALAARAMLTWGAWILAGLTLFLLAAGLPAAALATVTLALGCAFLSSWIDRRHTRTAAALLRLHVRSA